MEVQNRPGLQNLPRVFPGFLLFSLNSSPGCTTLMYSCPKCAYTTDRRSNLISHLKRKKPCFIPQNCDIIKTEDDFDTTMSK